MTQQISRQDYEQKLQEAAYLNHINRIRSFESTGVSYQYRNQLYDWQNAQNALAVQSLRWPSHQEIATRAEKIYWQRVHAEMQEDWFSAEQELSQQFTVV